MHLRGEEWSSKEEMREKEREGGMGDREMGKGLFHDHHGNEGAPRYLEVMSE